MLKVNIVKKEGADDSFLRKKIKKFNFKIDKNPEIVFCFGGDGTFLLAENKFPNIPKLMFKHSDVCNICHADKSIEEVFDSLLKKKYKIYTYYKLEASFKGKKYYCVNDFIIRNNDQRRAIRFDLEFNKKKEPYIGDGLVVSTSFGSGAYFNAITKTKFKKGIGIGLNNVNASKNKILLNEKDSFIIKITRGDALFSYNVDNKPIILKTNDIIKIKKSNKKFFLMKV
jgi:hypothetical protein